MLLFIFKGHYYYKADAICTRVPVANNAFYTRVSDANNAIYTPVSIANNAIYTRVSIANNAIYTRVSIANNAIYTRVLYCMHLFLLFLWWAGKVTWTSGAKNTCAILWTWL